MVTQIPDTQAELWNYVNGVRPEIERALLHYLPTAPEYVDAGFNDALKYALFPGGKRLRPVLTLLGAELVGGSGGDVLAAAAAVEYVHTSSLIFDDLPCMDNAFERRGLDALHRRYGEGLAVLVGLTLLNAAYGLALENRRASADQRIRALGELVSSIGTNGMVTGQTIDISAAIKQDGHDAVRNLKTSALIRLALRLGAILSGAKTRQLTALSHFAELLGQAYQLSDDVIDLVEDAALAGESGQQRAPTCAVRQGARDAMLRIAAITAEAKRHLASEFGREQPACLLLGDLADYIAVRSDFVNAKAG